jgi:hypothetical protein
MLRFPRWASPLACSMITRLFSAVCYYSVSTSLRRRAGLGRVPIVATSARA